MPFPPLFLLNVYQFCACVLKKYIDLFCGIKKRPYICLCLYCFLLIVYNTGII